MPCSAKFRNQNFQISSNLSFTIIWLCPPLYTYSPFILGKLTWPQKILEVLSDSPFPLMMPWLRSFTWYSLPYNDHIPHLTIVIFGKLPISARAVQKSNLNQIDGWVSILWEHLNCIQQQKMDSFYDLVEWKKVPCPVACPMHPSLLSVSSWKDEQLTA